MNFQKIDGLNIVSNREGVIMRYRGRPGHAGLIGPAENFVFYSKN